MKLYRHQNNSNEILFGIVSNTDAIQILKETNRYQFIPRLKPSLYPIENKNLNNPELIINPMNIFYSGEEGTLYKHLFVKQTPANNNTESCIRNNQTSVQCNGILMNYNIFNLRLKGFRIIELSIFVSNNMNLIIVPDEEYNIVDNAFSKYWNKTHLSLGGSILLYLLTLYNELELKEIVKDYENLSRNFLQKIIDLKYKEIEDFNFIIARYEMNLLNLLTVAKYNYNIINQYNPSNNPFFSELFESIGVQNENLNRDKISASMEWNFLNGIKPKILDDENTNITNNTCDCDNTDILINNIRFKSSGEYINTLKHNVCVVEGGLKCKDTVLFKYGDDGEYYVSFADDNSKPTPYNEDIYQKMMKLNMNDAAEILRNVEILISRKDDLLSKTFERMEFFNSRNMTILTIVSTIFLPISFISSWYGMNLMNVPEYDYMFMYPILTALTILIILGYLYFYRDVLFIQTTKYENKTRRNRLI
jgi:hypothetical protein